MNTHLPDISIIIPVYKAEKYITRCLESVKNQTFTDWEAILVDDGSPDSSGNICDLYAETDFRFKVIHKKNEGVSSARQTGINYARGKYSIHIDPDDYIDLNTLALLYNNAIKYDSDIVICDLLLDYGQHKEISNQKPIDNTSKSYLIQLLRHERHGSLCNKLIKTDLYKKYKLYFPVDMIIWEDLFICCQILLHSCAITYVPAPLYHYDLHSNLGSAIRKTSQKGLKSQILFCEKMESILPNNLRNELQESKWLCLVTGYRCKLLNGSQIRRLYPEINSHYIKLYSNSYNKSTYYGLCLVLRGYPVQVARIVSSVINAISKILKKI